MKKVAVVVIMAFAVALIVLPAVNSTEAAPIARAVKDPGGGGR